MLSTRSATFVSASATSLSQIWRPVNDLPSRPPRLLSLTPKVIFSVGGSIGVAGSGSETDTSHTVSVTVADDRPATETMSPAAARSNACLAPPLLVNSLVTRPVSRSFPSPAPIASALTLSPTFTLPLATRPVTSLPTNESCSIMDTRSLNGSWRDPGGGGTRSRSTSSSALMSPASSSHICRAESKSTAHTPARADAYTVAKSSCSSHAPIAAKRSKSLLSTSAHPVSVTASRSTLFSTTMGLRPFCKAFPSTNLVCAIGPSMQSTSKRHPSTMSRTRSTSPPKSAWPGVSTALNVVPLCSNDVYLEEIVMPRSFSRSRLSMRRSVATSWLAWRIRVSSSVVLPWSTCAMMAKLRTLFSVSGPSSSLADAVAAKPRRARAAAQWAPPP